MESPKFGTAGAGELFYSRGLKKSSEVPKFLAELGLNAFEYQCTRGVRIGEDAAKCLGEEAGKHNIALSVHAPYYISLAVSERERQEKNRDHFLKSAQAAKMMGAKRIVFHPGGVGKMSREAAYDLALRTMEYVMEQLQEEGLSDLTYCPETMGKLGQLGDLEEVLKFCDRFDNMLPCIDFGHLNCRSGGGVNSYEAFARIFDRIGEVLGEQKARQIHCHFSKIEYGAGGEKRHLTFSDTKYGPEFEPLMELLYQKNYTPVIICESAGTQAEDATAMAEQFYSYKMNDAE